MALLRNAVEADDLVQECLCRALATARPFGTIRDVRAYLFTVMHNLFVDQRLKQSKGADVVSDELVARMVTTHPQQIHRLELRDLCWALDKLSVEQKEILVLIGLEGFSYRAAAGILGLPVGTVMSRLFRAREALRELMDGEMPDETRGHDVDENRKAMPAGGSHLYR